MRLFQNRTLKKIFGPKEEVIKKSEENRVEISLITLLLTIVILVTQSRTKCPVWRNHKSLHARRGEI